MRFLVAILVFSSLAAASPNCQVSILTEKNSGQKLRVSFQSTLPSRNHCKKLAEMHEPNFNPQLVRRKSVTYRWNGQLSTLEKGSKSSIR